MAAAVVGVVLRVLAFLVPLDNLLVALLVAAEALLLRVVETDDNLLTCDLIDGLHCHRRTYD
jgi:hypothetical protein